MFFPVRKKQGATFSGKQFHAAWEKFSGKSKCFLLAENENHLIQMTRYPGGCFIIVHLYEVESHIRILQ
ncbi:MAG: hypothetical protein C0403_13655 [Desulfobacterium sp.]|nr:hypothetical protein [Desulfobacterium sp.]